MKLRYNSGCRSVVAAGMLLILSAGQAMAGEPLNVMSWNLRYDTPADSLNSWPYRRESIVATIRFHDVDIIGTQEGLLRQVQYLDSALTGFARCGCGREDGKNEGEFCAVFYRTERFERVSDTTIWLSPTPDKPSKGWDAALPRVVTTVILRDRTSGAAFAVSNTHLDHQGKQARLESAKVIAARIRAMETDLPVIVTGDFNSNPDEAPHAELMTAGLQDAFATTEQPHYGPGWTFCGFSVREGIIGERIDWILVSPTVRVLRHGILTPLKDDGRYVSDHLPVLAEILLP